MKDIKALGPWTEDLASLKRSYETAAPFPHVVIDEFFDKDYVEELLAKFPDPNDSNWFTYWNPIEKKKAFNKFHTHPQFQCLFQDVLQSPVLLDYIRSISGIHNLETDPHLHGAGLHYHPKGGKLDMHLDYSIHPLSGKERRLNLIIYLNKNWKEGGELQLWDADFTRPVKKIPPLFNTAVLFRTSDISYHGLPQPASEERRSVAIYYVSEPRSDVTHRPKAQFRRLPHQTDNLDKLHQLYDIRATRLITQDDLQNIWPTWEQDGNGFF